MNAAPSTLDARSGTRPLLPAMRILLALAEIFEAPRLIPVSSAHVSGASYKMIGDPGLEFLEDFARDARVTVPTTVNPLGTDLAQWKELGVPEEFAKKQARIALAYALYLDWGWDFPGVPRDSQLARGLRAADRALGLDSSSADAWMAMGLVRGQRYPRELTGVAEALERATTLDPRNAEAWHQRASVALVQGRWEASIEYGGRALVLEPARPVTWLNMAGVLELLHRDREALAAYDSALVVNPEFYAAYAYRAIARLRLGDVAGAEADGQAALRFSPRGEEYYGYSPLAAAAAARGDTVTARAHLDRAVVLLCSRVPGPFVAYLLAQGLLLSGQPDRAMDWLERAHPVGGALWYSMVYPSMATLRSTERFRRLLDAARPPGARDP